MRVECSAHFRTPDGEWHEFEEPPSFLLQRTDLVCAMFEGSTMPVVIKIDGGYVCNKLTYREVRSRHDKVITFAALPKTSKPLHEILELKYAL